MRIGVIEPHLEPGWDPALGLYLEMARLAGRWASGEADAQDVLREVASIIDHVGPLVDRVETRLGDVYQLDIASLATWLRQSPEDVRRLPLGSATSTP